MGTIAPWVFVYAGGTTYSVNLMLFWYVGLLLLLSVVVVVVFAVFTDDDGVSVAVVADGVVDIAVVVVSVLLFVGAAVTANDVVNDIVAVANASVANEVVAAMVAACSCCP